MTFLKCRRSARAHSHHPNEGADVRNQEPDRQWSPGITLTTDDIDATHGYMKSQGVDVDEQVSRMGDPVPPMFWFRDPDGNTLMVVQV